MPFHYSIRDSFRIKFASSLLVCFLVVYSGQVLASELRDNWATKAYGKNREAVVCIQGDKIDESANRGDSGKAYNGMGTGIVIDERGYIITNFHVVDGIRKIQVTTFDKAQYTAVLVARDTDTDLAVIKVNSRKALKTITLGRSDDLKPGENCLAIGNPYGYDFSLTDGRISGVGREVEVNDSLIYRDAIQTNTEINPGNSGGPLINVEGEMIGINAAIRQGASGIAFAIPVNQVIQVAAKLLGDIANEHVSHGLKVYQTAPDNTSDMIPSGEQYSVVVKSVVNNSSAAEAGIKEGDVIRQVGKYKIGNLLDFSRAFLDIQANDDLAFTIRRNSQTMDIALTLNAAKYQTAQVARRVQPKSSDITPKTASQVPSKSTALDEMVWENLGLRYVPMPKEEYREKYVKFLAERPHGGVVVKQVRDGSPLSEVGVMRGDVIVGIHDWVTTSENDVRYIAKNWSKIQSSDNKVQLLLFRDGTAYFTEVTLK